MSDDRITDLGEDGLLAIQQRHLAATPGPCVVEKSIYERMSVHYTVRTRDAVVPRANATPSPRYIAWFCGSLGEALGHRKASEYPDDPETLADATFYARAWEDVGALLVRLMHLGLTIVELRAENASLRNELDVDGDLRLTDKLALAENVIAQWTERCQRAEHAREKAELELAALKTYIRCDICSGQAVAVFPPGDQATEIGRACAHPDHYGCNDGETVWILPLTDAEKARARGHDEEAIAAMTACTPAPDTCPDCGTRPAWWWSKNGYCFRDELKSGEETRVRVDVDRVLALFNGDEAAARAFLNAIDADRRAVG